MIATKGNSEAFFYSQLKNVFGNQVQVDVTIPNQDWKFPFIPDVVFSNGHVTIDIEIDEPYTYNKLEPIHYFDIDKQMHVDTQRDAFFNQNCWIVVRFSEKQVYRYPLSCCKTIAEIIHKITDDNSYLFKLSNIENVVSDKFWTKKQAIEFARINYRNTYNGAFIL